MFILKHPPPKVPSPALSFSVTSVGESKERQDFQMRAIFVCFTQTSLSDIPNGQIKYLLSLHERPPPAPKLQV